MTLKLEVTARIIEVAGEQVPLTANSPKGRSKQLNPLSQLSKHYNSVQIQGGFGLRG